MNPKHERRPRREQSAGSPVNRAAKSTRVQNASSSVSHAVQATDPNASSFYDKSVADVAPVFSTKSLRAAEAAQLPRSMRPLEIGRRKVADSFDSILCEARKNHEWNMTNEAIATRDLKVTERQVRQWRENRKPMPLAALHALPVSVVRALVKDILEARGIEL